MLCSIFWTLCGFFWILITRFMHTDLSHSFAYEKEKPVLEEDTNKLHRSTPPPA